MSERVMNSEAMAAPKGMLDHPGWVRWGAHLGFWLVYFAVRTAAAAADPPKDMSEFPYLANRILVVASYFLLTGVLFARCGGPAREPLSLGAQSSRLCSAPSRSRRSRNGARNWGRCCCARLIARNPIPS